MWRGVSVWSFRSELKSDCRAESLKVVAEVWGAGFRAKPDQKLD